MIIVEYSTGEEQEIEIPSAENENSLLTIHTPTSIMKQEIPFNIIIYSNKLPIQLTIQIYRKEILLFATPCTVKKHKLNFELPTTAMKKYLPQGGVLSLVARTRKKIVGERLIFMEPVARVPLEVSPSEGGTFQRYAPGEEVNIRVLARVPNSLKTYANVRVIDTGPFKEIGKDKDHPLLPTLLLLETEIFRDEGEQLLFSNDYIQTQFKSKRRVGGNEDEELLNTGIYYIYIYIYRI